MQVSKCLGALQVAEVEMSAAPEGPKPKYRKDYTPTPYLIDSVSLDFVLSEDVTQVTTVQKVRPNHTGKLLTASTRLKLL